MRFSHPVKNKDDWSNEKESGGKRPEKRLED